MVNLPYLLPVPNLFVSLLFFCCAYTLGGVGVGVVEVTFC